MVAAMALASCGGATHQSVSETVGPANGSQPDALVATTDAPRDAPPGPSSAERKQWLDHVRAVVVRLVPGVDATPARLGQVLGVPVGSIREMGDGRAVVNLSAPMTAAGARNLADAMVRASVAVEAEPDLRVTTQATPDDSFYPLQWDLNDSYGGGPAEGIDVEAAWDLTTGSASVVSAVLDTGILAHPDLAGRTVPGYDFITDPFVSRDGDGFEADPTDPGDWTTGSEGCGPAANSSWHGTHVSGTIAATTNNGLGVAGIDRTGKILPVRVLGRCGGSLSDVADALRWAAGLAVPGVALNANPAVVANMSLGGPGACPTFFQDVINEVTAAGMTVVVAAGNDNTDISTSPYTPASCENVITVAASTRTGTRASYSNHGAPVDLAAPGGSITGPADERVLSTWNTGTTTANTSPSGWVYAYKAGTSMATPHVTGVVALIEAVNPGLGPAQVAAVVRNTVRGYPTSCAGCGAGLLDAGDAVAYALAAPVPRAGQDFRSDVIRGAGDELTYSLEQQLASLYNGSPGCQPDEGGEYCDVLAPPRSLG